MAKTLLSIIMIAYLLAFPKQTYAYIDPGTGSYFLQIVLATLLATPFIFREKLSGAYKALAKKFKLKAPKKDD